MSKTENSVTEEDFSTKLGIWAASPKDFRELIDLHAGDRVVVTAVGPSGIGKTAIPKQAAAARNGGKGVPYVAFHLPTMSLEDFHVPTFAADDRRFYDRRITRRLQPVLEWCETVRRDLGLAANAPLPGDMCPILAFEELNRAVDKSVTRAAFTVLDDRVIGDVTLDDSIQFVVTMNPSGGGMAVNEFEKDPAMRRRLTPMLGVMYSYRDMMAYAKAADWHPALLGFLSAQPNWGYDAAACKAGKAYACPASWERASVLMKKYEKAGLSFEKEIVKVALAGTLGAAAATALSEYAKDKTLYVTPEEVLAEYSPRSEVRRRVRAYLSGDAAARMDALTVLGANVAQKVYENLQRAPKSYAKQLASFMGDLPVDVMAVFVRTLHNEGHAASDRVAYYNTLNMALSEEPAFVAACKPLHEARKTLA